MIDPLDYIYKSDPVLEMQVICRILTSKKLPFGLIGSFFTEDRRPIYDALEKQWARDREIDPILISKEFDLEKILQMAGTFSEEAITRLRNDWKQRQYGEIIVATQAIENPNERIKKIIELAAKCEMVKPIVEYSQNEATLKLVNIISEINKKGKNISGLSTGLLTIDEATNGIERGKFYVIGALKKTGKSRFLIYLCAKFSEQGSETIFNSLEMNEVQLNSLITSHYSKIDSSRLAYQLPQRDIVNLSVGFSRCSEMKWGIYREYTPEDLRAMIEYKKCKQQVDVVCVDFIQRMRVPHLKNDRVREVEYISQRLADMSRELNVAVIALSQLSGVAENLPPEECPNMAHFKESQAIVENADTIITMHNPDRKGSPIHDNGVTVMYTPLQLKMRIEQRYGISGYQLPITADLRTCDFYCTDNKHNP